MKRLSLIACIVIASSLAFCSCRKDNDTHVSSLVYQATFAGSDDTKTAIDASGKVMWSPRERATFFRGGERTSFSSDNSAPAKQVNFTPVNPSFEWAASGDTWALYPENSSSTFDGSSVTTLLADRQTAVDGSFANNTALALARTQGSDNQLLFYNMCSGIRFCLTQGGCTSVTISGNGDEVIAGTVKAAFGEDGRPVIKAVTAPKKYVTLECKSGFKAGVWYYIMMLPVEMNSGLTMTFSYAGSTRTIKVEKAVSLRRNIILSAKDIDRDWVPDLKPIWSTSITDDMYFSTCAAGTSTSVQQGFDFDVATNTMYYSQVTGGYRNTISWRTRVNLTTSTALAPNIMKLHYFSHGNNIHYEKAEDGSYIWIGNYGTRDSEEKYTSPQTLARVKLVNGATVRNTETTENWFFGPKNIHASFDVENDQLAIFSQSDNYTVKIYRLSEVLAVPETTITLPNAITYGGGTEKKSPDPEWSGKPVVKVHDCSKLKPLHSFTYRYTNYGRGWQTYCLHGGKVYFYLFYSTSSTGMAYQSVLDVFDLQGNRLAADIVQPFADNIDDLSRYNFTDVATKYMENEGILVRNDALYLLYTAKNAAGFRRPVIFQLDAKSIGTKPDDGVSTSDFEIIDFF